MNNEQKPATLDDVVAILQKNQEILEEIKTWSKINNVEKVKKILMRALDTTEKIIIYHLSNGTNSSYEIARKIGANDTARRKISDYWKRVGKGRTGENLSHHKDEEIVSNVLLI